VDLSRAVLVYQTILLSFTKISHVVCVSFSGCIEAGDIIDSRPNNESRRYRNEESKSEMKGGSVKKIKEDTTNMIPE
jgi:hypothetical protein